MRRLYSFALAVALVTNALAWPGFALAESFDHQHEAAQVGGTDSAPAEPGAAHGHHGCAGHYGQHMQGPHSVAATPLPPSTSEAPDASLDLASDQHVPLLPFRPPLAALIQS